MTSKIDLQFVATRDLIKEVFNRADCAILLMNKTTVPTHDNKHTSQMFFIKKGTLLEALGLVTYLQVVKVPLFVDDEHLHREELDNDGDSAF